MSSINDFENMIEPEIELTFNDQKIMVQKYITESEKIYIANKIRSIVFGEDLITYEEGMEELAVTNKNLKHALIVTYVIRFYTDIDIDDVGDVVRTSTIVINSGLYDKVLGCLSLNERSSLFTMIDEAIAEKYREIQEENSVENQLKRFLSTVLEKIPTDSKIAEILESVKQTVNNFDPKKLKFLNKTTKKYTGTPTPTAEEVTKMSDTLLEVMKVKN